MKKIFSLMIAVSVALSTGACITERKDGSSADLNGNNSSEAAARAEEDEEDPSDPTCSDDPTGSVDPAGPTSDPTSSDDSTVSNSTSSDDPAETGDGARAPDTWIIPDQTGMTDDMNELFTRAMDGLVGVGYTPRLCLGTMDCGGTMYCFLCESVVIVPDAIPYWSLVYIFEDSEGNATVTGMHVPNYSVGDDHVTVSDISAEQVPGGWSAVTDQQIDPEELIENAAGNTNDIYEGKIVLASQVVAGSNYAVLCESEDDMGGRSWDIVYVYQDLQGNLEVLSSSVLDIGLIYGPVVRNDAGGHFCDICRRYLEENDAGSIDTILDIDHPDIAQIPSLPLSYAVVTEGEGAPPYYSYCYRTTQDALLGPIVFILDSNGTILGLGYRE